MLSALLAIVTSMSENDNIQWHYWWQSMLESIFLQAANNIQEIESELTENT
jgi:predicted alpha-1,6-mannanase (GH76 family)